jgi:hypothetical protein
MDNAHRVLLASVLTLALVGGFNRAHAQRVDWVSIHAQNDEDVAKRSGLKRSQVKSLRDLAGISDASPDLLERADTSLLATKNVLVLSSYGGSAGCVQFWVFSRADDSFNLVWNMGEAGDEANFCADRRCSLPRVRLKKNLDVVVEIPSFRDGKCSVHSTGKFQWNGAGYTYKGILAVPKSK